VRPHRIGEWPISTLKSLSQTACQSQISLYRRHERLRLHTLAEANEIAPRGGQHGPQTGYVGAQANKKENREKSPERRLILRFDPIGQ
jgi:hypothetical protein